MTKENYLYKDGPVSDEEGRELLRDLTEEKTDGLAPEDPNIYKNMPVSSQSEYYDAALKFKTEIMEKINELNDLTIKFLRLKETAQSKKIQESIERLRSEINILNNEFNRLIATDMIADKILLDPEFTPPEFEHKQ